MTYPKPFRAVSLLLVVGMMAMAFVGCDSQSAIEENDEMVVKDTKADVQANQRQGGQANFGNLIAALNNINAQLRLLERADINIENIQVVRVRDIRNNLNDNQIQVLNNAFRDANIQVLHDAIENNEVLKNFLNNNDIAINDVVAINVLSGGDVTVFVDEQGVLPEA